RPSDRRAAGGQRADDPADRQDRGTAPAAALRRRRAQSVRQSLRGAVVRAAGSQRGPRSGADQNFCRQGIPRRRGKGQARNRADLGAAGAQAGDRVSWPVTRSQSEAAQDVEGGIQVGGGDGGMETFTKETVN